MLTLASIAVRTGDLPAQELQVAANDGPRFYVEVRHSMSSGEGGTTRVDASNAAMFRRAVALDLRGVSLPEALHAIARVAGLELVFSQPDLHLDGTVSLSSPSITVGGALTAVLYGKGVDVQLSRDGQSAALVPRDSRVTSVAPRARQATATIAGQVTDARTGQPMVNATVIVEGTGHRATTKNDGQYAIGTMRSGIYIVTARLLGYTPLSKRVEIRADSVVHVDFALTEAAAVLEEMVTTAVGDQRKVELGNSIATINADSVVRAAPITQVTDILSGRAPGVEVLEQQGQVGAGPRIRIRGVSSFTLSNDPIMYVDGVRVDNAAGSLNGAAAFASTPYPTPSRLNDIDPADIASIDVLKGPSAATEYGTDAANGVIVIKTKRGQAGSPRWDIHAEQGLSTVPPGSRFEVPWKGWGRTTDGSNTPIACPRTFGGGPTVANGGCVLDSVTTFQPLDHSTTTMFGTGTQSRVGTDLLGGTQQFQYFVSGRIDKATGVVQLPPFEHQQVARQDGSIPGYVVRPNALNQSDIRSRVTASLGTQADVGFSAAYIANQQRSADDGLPIEAAVFGPGFRDSANGGYGAGLVSPANAFALTGSQTMRRFSGSANGTWRPAAWLTTRATAGIDLGHRTDDNFQAPGPAGFPVFPGATSTGYHGIGQVSTTLYTVDVGATAGVPLGSDLLSKTSAGFQYNVRNQTGVLAQAYGLTANGSLNGASVYLASQIDSEAKTVGSYVEENVGWRDLLFLTGALRIDAGSGFGSQINAAVYPKMSLSWAVIRAPSHRLRLRAAYGESGVQPPSGATLSLYAPATFAGASGVANGDTGVTVANPRLQPERSAELETGADAGIFDDRVTLELTYYRKQTHNTIVSNILPGSNGGRVMYENLGSVLNYGIEGSVTARVLQTRPVSWDVTVGASLNQNRLLSLGVGQPPISAPSFPFFVQYRQVPGYPLFGYWAPQLQYADANHNGVIDPSEVSVTSTTYFQGSSIPTRVFTANSGLGLFNERVRIAAQVDYRGGFKIQNELKGLIEAFNPGAAAFNDPRASLADQARAVEQSVIGLPLTNAYFEDGSFVRWREFSVTYVLADRLTRSLHLHASSLTFLGRNLALWTRYSGADPEVTTLFTAGAPADGVYDFGATPQVRSWALRVNLAL